MPEINSEEICSKVKQNYTEGGISQVFRKGIDKILYLIYHTNNAYWFRMDLREEIKVFPGNNENISIHFNNPDETIQYIKEYGYYYPMEISTGLASGHLYTGLKYKEKIIGYNKTGFSEAYIEDFKKVYKFPYNVAYTYDTFVAPAYRNRHYGAFLLSEVCKSLKQRGFKSIWAHIPSWNNASIAMHQKLGFKRHQLIRYYRIAGISWTTRNPVKFIQSIEK